MKKTIETRLLQKFLELRPQDQVDVLDYMQHIQRVRQINETVSYQENALREIRTALIEDPEF